MRDCLSDWCERGYVTADGQPIRDRELVIYLSRLMETRLTEATLVRGYPGEAGSEGAEALAGIACCMAPVVDRKWVFRGWSQEPDLPQSDVLTPDGFDVICPSCRGEQAALIIYLYLGFWIGG